MPCEWTDQSALSYRLKGWAAVEVMVRDAVGLHGDGVVTVVQVVVASTTHQDEIRQVGQNPRFPVHDVVGLAVSRGAAAADAAAVAAIRRPLPAGCSAQ